MYGEGELYDYANEGTDRSTETLSQKRNVVSSFPPRRMFFLCSYSPI
jgi:hypothetical protein